METRPTELEFDFLGTKYTLSYFTKTKQEKAGKKTVNIEQYFASFEDKDSDFFMDDNLIFKLNKSDHTLTFTAIDKGTIGLRLSMADAILMHEYLRDTPERDD